ncbi:MAG: hypothetical protein IKS17_07485 [Firmicutes bacterium]|nr:hypothetical protein [Bacillota bacterium]
MKLLKRAVSAFLSTAVAVSCFAGVNVAYAAEPTLAGGWNETLYAQWTDSNPSAATVTYKHGGVEKTLTGEDKAFLQRTVDGSARVDIPGLAPGRYDLTIKASNGTVYEKTGINVPKQDRSGYAHFNYSEGVGAYNSDGTLKANAVVLYVTEENKNTVTLSYGGKSVTGIGNILNSRGATKDATVQNTNGGILTTLAENNIPLVVRIVGKVEAGDTNTKGGTNFTGENVPVPSESINGLTAYNSTDYGGSAKDNGMMARMIDATNITIEGIGHDACIDGWGFHLVASSAGASKKFARNFEVRNITFANYPEDAIGMEGQQEGSTVTAPVSRCWIHNNTFKCGYCKSPAESDKKEGDGSCDFKRGEYYTLAYNKFENCHKTNLIGASDSNLQYNITMHHNYWSDCKARGPLARKANIHMYNNYVYRQTDYAENARANAFIFSEYCYFEGCKGALAPAGGRIASYNDTFLSCLNSSEDACKVSSRSEAVYDANLYGNFVVDSSQGYIKDGNYSLTSNSAQAKAECIAYSGAMKKQIITSDTVDTSVIPAELYNKAAASPVEIPYSIDYTSSTCSLGKLDSPYTKSVHENLVYNLAKKYSPGNAAVVGQAGIVFFLNQSADVTLDGVSGTATPVIYTENGDAVIKTSGTATLAPGVYMVQSSIFDVGTSTYKEAKVNSLTFKAKGEGETVTATQKETTTEGTTVSAETTSKSQGGEDETETEPETEPVTSDPSGYAAMGKYVFGSSPSETGDYKVSSKSVNEGNIDFIFRNISTSSCSLRADDGTGIAFALAKPTKAEIKMADGKAAVLIENNTGMMFELPGNAVSTYQLAAGSYSIEGIDPGSNSKISVMTLTEISSPQKGDVDVNGVVDRDDAALLLKYLGGTVRFTTLQIELAKVNTDSAADMLDVIAILNKN